MGDYVPVEMLMKRIRHLVLVNRIQLKTFFEDFDSLRSGHMTRSQFGRALSNSSLSRLGHHDLTPVQLEKLADAYACKKDGLMVNWRKFVNDVNLGEQISINHLS